VCSGGCRRAVSEKEPSFCFKSFGLERTRQCLTQPHCFWADETGPGKWGLALDPRSCLQHRKTALLLVTAPLRWCLLLQPGVPITPDQACSVLFLEAITTSITTTTMVSTHTFHKWWQVQHSQLLRKLVIKYKDKSGFEINDCGIQKWSLDKMSRLFSLQ
jgi:hypothetical protein